MYSKTYECCEYWRFLFSLWDWDSIHFNGLLAWENPHLHTVGRYNQTKLSHPPSFYNRAKFYLHCVVREVTAKFWLQVRTAYTKAACHKLTLLLKPMLARPRWLLEGSLSSLPFSLSTSSRYPSSWIPSYSTTEETEFHQCIPEKWQ